MYLAENEQSGSVDHGKCRKR